MKDKKQSEYIPHTGSNIIADVMSPCPCCGGDPILNFYGNDYTKSRSVTIKCQICRLQLTVAAIRNDAEWCANVAIEKWNKRV